MNWESYHVLLLVLTAKMRAQDRPGYLFKAGFPINVSYAARSGRRGRNLIGIFLFVWANLDFFHGTESWNLQVSGSIQNLLREMKMAHISHIGTSVFWISTVLRQCLHFSVHLTQHVTHTQYTVRNKARSRKPRGETTRNYCSSGSKK